MMRKINVIAYRALAAALVLALLAVISPSAVFADLADAEITVTDGGTVVYADNGLTFISKPTDVYVQAKSGVAYYLLESGYVDVIYNSDEDYPLGSYFKQPFVMDSRVTTIASNINTNSKKEITEQDAWKIPIPSLAPGEVYNLRIMAVKSGADDVVYAHRFIGSGVIFTANADNGAIVVNALNSAELAVSGTFIIAVYTEDGRLFRIETGPFNANSGGSDSYRFDINISDYPSGDYMLKAYCWNTNFVPLAPVVEIN